MQAGGYASIDLMLESASIYREEVGSLTADEKESRQASG